MNSKLIGGILLVVGTTIGAGMLALAFWLRSQRNRPTDLPLEQL